MERLKQLRMTVGAMLTRDNSQPFDIFEFHPLLRHARVTCLIFFVGCGICHVMSVFVELTGFAYVGIVFITMIVQYCERKGLFDHVS